MPSVLLQETHSHAPAKHTPCSDNSGAFGFAMRRAVMVDTVQPVLCGKQQDLKK